MNLLTDHSRPEPKCKVTPKGGFSLHETPSQCCAVNVFHLQKAQTMVSSSRRHSTRASYASAIFHLYCVLQRLVENYGGCGVPPHQWDPVNLSSWLPGRMLILWLPIARQRVTGGDFQRFSSCSCTRSQDKYAGLQHAEGRRHKPVHAPGDLCSATFGHSSSNSKGTSKISRKQISMPKFNVYMLEQMMKTTSTRCCKCTTAPQRKALRTKSPS